MPAPDTLTSKVIKEGLAENIAPFFLVETAPLPGPIFFPIVEAFWEAVRIISPTIRTFRQINILFGSGNFTINMSSGTLVYSKKSEVINACFNDIIFIDCDRLLFENDIVRVVCILEELVHTLYNVSDEVLATKIVCLLFPKVSEANGKYCIKN